MRKLFPAFEAAVLCAVGALLLVLSVLVVPLRNHLHPASPRLLYALAHLPAALLASAAFTFAAALVYRLMQQGRMNLERQPTSTWIAALSLLFCSFWLPVLLSSGFVHDDWMLLAAAAIRTNIPAHPLLAWSALDSVDGNFRPLGAVLFYTYGLRLFGLHPTLFLLVSFLLNLGSTLTAFFIVRRMGYGRPAAAASALLFLSRGVLYTQSCWAADLGDCIVLFLTGLVILLLLQALQRRGSQALLLHLAAWLLFGLSTLAKQSSFATPMIVAALLFLRPGLATPPLPLRRRLTEAIAALLAYGAVAAAIFLHARSLFGAHNPYPMQLTAATILRSFAYFFWYFFAFYFPARIPLALYLPGLIGLALFVALALLLRRYPAAFGERPRDLLFLALAAIASISLFLGLTNRNEAYYGTECAFWLSIAFGIMLTRFGSPRDNPAARVACFALCLLAVAGFFDVRLKQVSLIWSGGYVWGNTETVAYRRHLDSIQHALARQPAARDIVIVDPPPVYSFFAAMILLLDPSAERIFVYLPKTGTWVVNNHEGLRPTNTVPALSDADAYNWLTPITRERVLTLTRNSPILALQMTGNSIATSDIFPDPERPIENPPPAPR